MCLVKICLAKLFIICSISGFVVYAGDRIPISQEQPGLKFCQVISILEELHSVRIFYEADWFEDQSFNNPPAGLPLYQAVSNLIRGKNMIILQIDDYLVIVPDDTGTGSLKDGDTLLLTIGNPAAYGRYTRADFSGRILDGTTGESLPGAVIYNEKTGTGSSAGMNGEFLVNLPAGEQLIRITYIGYEDQVRKINLLGHGNYDFYLFEETHAIDEVTIMAKRAEANVSRTQMGMISMDSRLLKELPASFGEQDLIKSMTLLPGIQSIGEFGAGFNVRGGKTDQNLILIENVPVFNSSHLFGLISVLNPDMVSGITLYKSGIPARYGERVSSVMDIRINPGNIEEMKMTAGIGLLSSRLHLELPVVNDKLTFSAGGRTSYSNWLLDRVPAEELLNSSAGFHDLSGLLSFTPDRNNSISLFAYYSNDAFSYTGNSEYQYRNMLSSIKWNSVLGEKLSLNVSGGLSRYDYNVKETEESFPFSSYKLNSSIEYHNIRTSLSWFPDGNHRVEFGFNTVTYGINPGNLEPVGKFSIIQPSRLDGENGIEFSLFLSDEFELSESISTEVGFRYTSYLYLGPATVTRYDNDYPRRTDFITGTSVYGRNEKAAEYGGLEPRLSLRYGLTRSSSIKASYTRNKQYINLVSKTAVITPSDIWKLSDTHLKPLISDNFSAGYFRNFRNNIIETSAEIYYRNFRNIIEYRDDAELLMNRNIETELINASGYNYGIELYAGKSSGRLNGWASYSFTRSMIKSDSRFIEDQVNNNNWFPSDFDRPHEFIINAGYNISRRWRIGGSFTFISGRPVTLPELSFPYGDKQLVWYSGRNKYRLPPYHRLDLEIIRGETIKINKRRSGNWTISLLNAYGRKNPYSVYYEREQTGTGIGHRPFNLYKLYIIGRPLPTVTYNFRF
jgi:hypothetical protein